MSIQTERKPPTSRNAGEYNAPHTSPVTPAEDFRTVLLNRVSWGAVTAGVAVALATHIILSLIGMGIGIAAVNPADITASTYDVSFGSALWWMIAGVLAALAGGFTAGRLSGEPKESTAAWHGFISWAASILVVAALMTTAAGVLVGGSFTVLADMTGSNAETIVNPLQAYQDALPGTAGTTVDAEAAADAIGGAALLSAVALILGAIAAWLSGRAGAVSPTVTSRNLRRTPS